MVAIEVVLTKRPDYLKPDTRAGGHKQHRPREQGEPQQITVHHQIHEQQRKHLVCVCGGVGGRGVVTTAFGG